MKSPKGYCAQCAYPCDRGSVRPFRLWHTDEPRRSGRQYRRRRHGYFSFIAGFSGPAWRCHQGGKRAACGKEACPTQGIARIVRKCHANRRLLRVSPDLGRQESNGQHVPLRSMLRIRAPRQDQRIPNNRDNRASTDVLELDIDCLETALIDLKRALDNRNRVSLRLGVHFQIDREQPRPIRADEDPAGIAEPDP